MYGSHKSIAFQPNYICNIVKNLCFIILSVLASASAAEQTIEEIIVTSDFRDLSLLETTASITILDSNKISQRNAKHLEQLLNIAPNVNFSSGASRGKFIQIRGIGERSQFIEPLNPSVGILVDGSTLRVLLVQPLLWIPSKLKYYVDHREPSMGQMH